ncbi:MAG: lamin tail domain-containing protein [Bernardetiaceae bacterium]
MRCFLFLLFGCWLGLFVEGASQVFVQDDFSDNDFTQNPTWSGIYFIGGSGPGQVAVSPGDGYTVNSNQELQSQMPSGGSGTRQTYLTTAVSPTLDMNDQDLVWSFEVQTPRSLGNTNKILIWLAASETNIFENSPLASPTIIGYVLDIQSEVTLQYRDGTNAVPIFSGGSLSTSTRYQIEVTRRVGGSWQVRVDGQAIGRGRDQRYTEVPYVGMNYVFSANPQRNDFIFDDFLLGVFTDTVPPVLRSAVPQSSIRLELVFDEALDPVSAQNTDHYLLNGTTRPQAAALDPLTREKVQLDFGIPFDFSNTITVRSVADADGNTIPDSLVQFFIFDNQPPSISTVLGTGSRQLRVTFSEPVILPEATRAGNYTVTPGIGSAAQATFASGLDSVVFVEFPLDFSAGVSYTLQATNISDTSNNILSSGQYVFAFADTLPPEAVRVEVISPNAIDVFFNESLDPVSAATAGNYAIMAPFGRPSAAVLDATDSRLVHLFFDDNFRNNTAYDLEIQNIADRSAPPNAMTSPQTIRFVYDTRRPDVCPVGCVQARSANQVMVIFDEIIDPITAQIINHYQIIDPFVETATNALLDPRFPNQVLLTFNTSFPPEQAIQLRIRNVEDLSGNTMTTRTRAFVHDPRPPRVQRVVPFDTTQVLVVFSEAMDRLSSEMINFYLLNQGFGSPRLARQEPLTPDQVILDFGRSINDRSDLELRIEYPEDLQGNALSPAETFRFSTLAPQLAQVLAVGEHVVQVRFSEPVDSTAQDPSRYSIGGIGVGVSVTTVSSSTYQVTFPSNFTNGNNYTINTLLINDLNGNTLTSGTASFIYQSRVVSVTAIGANLLELVFEQELDPGSANDPNKFFVDRGVGYAAAAIVDNATVRLAFDTTFRSDTDYLLTAAIGGIAFQNRDYAPTSVHRFRFDDVPPVVDRVVLLELDQILVIFDEPLDRTTAEALNHYRVSGGIGQPNQVRLSTTDPRRVTLDLPAVMQYGSTYTLTVRNVRDQIGNQMESQVVPIPLPTPPNEGDLRITEIFANPVPSRGLPEEEFLEIYNNTNQTINLFGILVQRNTSFTRLPSYDLPAEQYLILTRSAAAARYDSLGATLGVSSISMAITSGTIRLLAQDSSRIDSVVYSRNWHDSTKQAGGWSLELINIESSCKDQLNWASSQDSTGGTPGRANSIRNREVTAPGPRMESLRPGLPDTLLLTFDAAPDAAAMRNPANYLITGLGVQRVRPLTPKSVVLYMDQPINPDNIYTLVVQNLSNCLGIAANDTATFAIGNKPNPFEVIITEIMADETPPVGLPETEYIEIYNRSSRIINLATLQLEDGSSKVALPEGILPPNQYLTLTKTTTAGLFSVPAVGVPSFPSLSNTGEPLTLLDTSNVVIFAMQYSSSWYQDPDKADGGWALEMIDPNNPCGERNNWRASIDPSGGTPARQNSVFGENPDTENPRIAQFEVIGDTALRVVFSEVMARATMLDPANYTLTGGLGIARIDYVGVREVRLVLRGNVQPNITYTLTISGATDCLSKPIADSRSFGKGREPQANEIVINEIMARPAPVVGLPDAEYIEIYNTTNDILALEAMTLDDGNRQISLPALAIPAGAYWVLCTGSRVEALQTYTPNVMGVTNFPSLTISGKPLIFRNLSGQIVDQLRYSDRWYGDAQKAQGGWSLERIDPQNRCGEADNWRASQDSLGGTPGRINSIFANNPDTTAPRLEQVVLLGDSVLELLFSERMDTLALEEGRFYTLNNGLIINQIQRIGDRQVQLLVDPLPNVLYQLTVGGVSDCAGNAMADTVFRFGLGVMPEFNELLITEIFANIRPTAGLPERQYIEILNVSERILDLSSVLLRDNGGQIQLPSRNLNPGEYLILCSSTSAPLFAPFGEAVGVSGFPSLLIGGELLELRRSDGKRIFSVNYQDTWYDDAEKRNGGWSLEMIDPSNPCGGINNWTASRAAIGGTPGQINSVFGINPDTIPPLATRVQVISNNRLSVQFDEVMNESELLGAAYVMSDGVAIDSVIVSGPESVLLLLGQSLVATQRYTLTIKNISDCVGNLLTEQSITFGLGAVPGFNELLITEIFANTTPSVGLPEDRFLEIFNPTDKILNLAEVMLEDDVRSAQLPNYVLFPGAYVILTNTSAVPDYARFGEVLGVSGMPTITQAGKELRLRTTAGDPVFAVRYSDAWYRDEIKKNGGWTLEMIDTGNPCGQANNWRAAEAAVGGTPGQPNSVQGNNPDNRPPVLRAVVVEDAQTLLVQFDEKLEPIQFLNFASFRIDRGISVVGQEVVSDQEMRLRLNPSLQVRTIYTLTASNITDCLGNLIGDQNSRTFVLPERGAVGDLIINEILFDAPVGGTDFVEIYNRSDKYIDLKGWQWARWRDDAIYTPRAMRTEALVIAPKAYYVFSNSNARLLAQYPRGAQDRFVEMNLPAFTSTEGSVLLLNPEDSVFDRFDYDRDFHFGLLPNKKGVSLERIRFSGQTNDRNNWHSAAATAGYGTPGFLNSQHIENPMNQQDADCFSLTNEVFSPDGDGFRDFTQLDYNCPAVGQVATISIYDARGRKVRTLIQNQSLAVSGTIIWDGIRDDGQAAKIGYYLFLIELYDLEGRTQRIQKKVVVGAKF